MYKLLLDIFLVSLIVKEEYQYIKRWTSDSPIILNVWNYINDIHKLIKLYLYLNIVCQEQGCWYFFFREKAIGNLFLESLGWIFRSRWYQDSREFPRKAPPIPRNRAHVQPRIQLPRSVQEWIIARSGLSSFISSPRGSPILPSPLYRLRLQTGTLFSHPSAISPLSLSPVSFSISTGGILYRSCSCISFSFNWNNFYRFNLSRALLYNY